ncbi:MAG: hypothetical protein VXX94_11520, partial [Verrucomicrobiota bacterium]|nr:hypothetical protein [Verrucomicrobiota bacterium]
MIQAPPYPSKPLEEGVSRRTFLEQLSLLGASSGILQLASALQGTSVSQGAPKKVALLATEVRRHSHAQH